MISTLMLSTSVLMAMSDRAETARIRVEPRLITLCRTAHVSYPPKQIMLRAYKQNRILEVWGANSPRSELHLIKWYPILAASGTLGPKRKAGDMQVPEGWYSVSQFNPNSAYHLSMGLNYPNASDRYFATAKDPGKDIFIHGNHVSAGCLAMGDPAIEEIYTLARMSSNRVFVLLMPGTNKMFPFTKNLHSTLWGQLAAISSQFDQNHVIPSIQIDRLGNYVLR